MTRRGMPVCTPHLRTPPVPPGSTPPPPHMPPPTPKVKDLTTQSPCSAATFARRRQTEATCQRSVRSMSTSLLFEQESSVVPPFLLFRHSSTRYSNDQTQLITQTGRMQQPENPSALPNAPVQGTEIVVVEGLDGGFCGLADQV